MLQLIIDKLSKLDAKVDTNHKELTGKMDKGFEKVNERINRLGFDLAVLQDDAPTRKEYKNLEKRVTRLEKHSPSIV